MEFIFRLIGGIASMIAGTCSVAAGGIKINKMITEERSKRKEQEALPENTEEETEEEA